MSQQQFSTIKYLLALIALFALFAPSLQARRGLRADNGGSGGGSRYALSDAEAQCMRHPSCATSRICPAVCYFPTPKPAVMSDLDLFKKKTVRELRADGGLKLKGSKKQPLTYFAMSDSSTACLPLPSCRPGMMCPAVCYYPPKTLAEDFTIDDVMRWVNKAEKIANILGYERPEDVVEELADQMTLSDASSGYKMSNAEALGKVRAAGISVHSSGGCHDRNVRSCTSLDQINSGTIDKIITLKRASGCPITITGGTEVGHAGGAMSHANGYKVDISLNSCINGYITRSFSYIGKRGDGSDMYKASSGSIYAKEGNHWDITYP